MDWGTELWVSPIGLTPSSYLPGVQTRRFAPAVPEPKLHAFPATDPCSPRSALSRSFPGRLRKLGGKGRPCRCGVGKLRHRVQSEEEDELLGPGRGGRARSPILSTLAGRAAYLTAPGFLPAARLSAW